MPAALKGRKYGIVAASLAVHVVLAALLVLNAPRLRIPEMSSGPPEPIIPILIMPRTPPNAAAPDSRPTAIRLHRRQTRFSAPPPVAPLVAPERPETAARPAPTAGPKTITLPPYEDALATNARNALRSRRNCDDPNLSRSEREACQERLFGAGRDAPQLPLGIDPGKASDLARAALRKEQDYGYKRSAGGGPGTTGSGYDNGKIATPGAPNLGMGASGHDLGGVTGNDSRRELKVPF
jgi:hypothetical protein